MRVLIAFSLLAFALTAAAQLYRWTDANGKVHYTDTPPPHGIAAITLPTTPSQSEAAPEPKHSKASLEDVNAVPYLSNTGREAYRRFLKLPPPRAFVLCKDGRYSAFSSATDEFVAQDVKKAIHTNKANMCRTYVLNNDLVW